MIGSARSGSYRQVPVALVTLLVAGALVCAPQVARAQYTCAGDCQGTGMPNVTGIIALVNIVLGNNATCEDGVPPGAPPSVTTIIQAVNNVLNGTCAMAPPPGCGNGVVDSGEDCDNGGVCIGGTNAGTACTSETQCSGQGVCVGGTKAEWVCDTDSDCPDGGSCRHCIPQEGNGCASNCTTESNVDVTLVPGENPNGDQTSLMDGTSGLVVNGPLTVGIPLPMDVTRQLTIGKEKDGQIPVVLKSETNQTPGVDVLGGQACICLRPIVLQTCGGTLWNKDGTPSTNCTANYTMGDSVCAGTKPCTFVYGADNIGAGTVGCNSLNGVDVETTQDSGGASGMAGPVLTTLSGSGPAGSAVIFDATELGFVVAPCTGSNPAMYGNDGVFCTADDPQSARGSVLPQVLTTGTATASVFNADKSNQTIGPFSPQAGQPLSCSVLASGSASGGALVGAFPDLGAPTVMDIVVTDQQIAQ